MDNSRSLPFEKRFDCLGAISISFLLTDDEIRMNDFWRKISHTKTSPTRSNDPVDITLVTPPSYNILDGLNAVRDYERVVASNSSGCQDLFDSGTRLIRRWICRGGVAD